MEKIRSILLTFAFFVFGIGALFFNFIVFPLAKIILKEGSFIFFASFVIQKLWRFFISFMVFIGLIKLDIKNKEKIKNVQNKVIVSTHPSFIDIVILVSLFKRSTCFVKSKLTKNFVMKNLVNSIFIPNDVDIETLKSETKKYLDKGFNVIVFPMGTRHRADEFPKIKKGAALIAQNAFKDIVPVKLKTSEDFLFVNQPFYSAGKKRVNFELEVCDIIEIEKFYNENEIVMKQKITKEITNALYS